MFFLPNYNLGYKIAIFYLMFCFFFSPSNCQTSSYWVLYFNILVRSEWAINNLFLTPWQRVRCVRKGCAITQPDNSEQGFQMNDTCTQEAHLNDVLKDPNCVTCSYEKIVSRANKRKAPETSQHRQKQSAHITQPHTHVHTPRHHFTFIKKQWSSVGGDNEHGKTYSTQKTEENL